MADLTDTFAQQDAELFFKETYDLLVNDLCVLLDQDTRIYRVYRAYTYRRIGHILQLISTSGKKQPWL